MADKTPTSPKQPFVSQADRPEVRLKSDTPLSELTRARPRHPPWPGRRHRQGLLGRQGLAEGRLRRPATRWKEGKEFKEGKEARRRKREGEGRKEKPEIKEVKVEKLESDGVSSRRSQPDPRLDQVIQALSGLSAKVAELADQVEELKKGKAKP